MNADLAFEMEENGNGNSTGTASPEFLDAQIRACFVRFFADLLHKYQMCLQIIRIHPTPVIAFHKVRRNFSINFRKLLNF